MKLMKPRPPTLLMCLLLGTAAIAQEQPSVFLPTPAAQPNTVHPTEVPWFVADKDSKSYNVTGGSFSTIDAFPDVLSRVTFNGREVTSSKSLAEIDSQLLSSSEFSRLGAASQYLTWLTKGGYNSATIENMIAGQVDISVLKPLDAMPGLHANASAAYNNNADQVYDADGIGGQVGITYVDQLLDDTLGVMVISEFERMPVANLESKAWYGSDWDQNAGRPLYGPVGYLGGTEGGDKDYFRNYLALQWRPSSAFEANYDLLYSKRKQDSTARGYEISNVNRFPNVVTPSPAAGQNQVFEGVFNGSAMEAGSVNSNYGEDESLLVSGLNLRFDQGPWTLSTDLEYSKSEFDSAWDAVKSGNNAPSTSLALFPDGSFGFGQDLTDPTANLPSTLNASRDTIDDEMGVVGLDFKRLLDFGLMDSLEFGLRGTDRTKTARYTQAGKGTTNTDPFGSALMGTGQSDGIDYLIFDINQVIDSHFGGGFGADEFAPNYDKYNGGYDVDETTGAGYVKFNFSQKIGNGFGLQTDAGLRMVTVGTESTGTQVDYIADPTTGSPTTVTEDHDYTRFLPSLNLSLFPMNGNYAVGFSASRRMAKAQLEQLSATTKVYTPWPGANPTTHGFAEGGNPGLDPWDINQFDLTFDWHFMDLAYISALASYKDLDSYIARGFEDETINGQTYSVLRPMNAGDAHISSLALRYNQPFSFLPAPFDQLGFFVSGIVNESNAEELHNNTEPDITQTSLASSYPLLGLADLSVRSVLYFSYDKFDVALRHTFLGEHTVEIDSSIRKLATAEPKSEWDLRFGYSATPKLTLLFEIHNLTNEKYSYYYNRDERRKGGSIDYGQSYNLGIGYSF